jgi:hypothetical protein
MFYLGHHDLQNTVSFVVLDKGSEMIIFESIFTILKQASFFEAAGAVAKIGLNLKLNNYWQTQLA